MRRDEEVEFQARLLGKATTSKMIRQRPRPRTMMVAPLVTLLALSSRHQPAAASSPLVSFIVGTPLSVSKGRGTRGALEELEAVPAALESERRRNSISACAVLAAPRFAPGWSLSAGESACVTAGALCGRRRRRARVIVNGATSKGDTDGSRDSGNNASDASPIDVQTAPEMGEEEFDAVWSRAALNAREEEMRRSITDPMDLLYATMPAIQEQLREAMGKEGIGAGYEDVRVGFYRDSNLKPANWKDAMVSMKPGSGTKGLGLDYEDYAAPDMVDDVQGRVGVGLLKDKIEEALLDGREGDQLLESLGVDPSEITEEERADIEARRSFRREQRRQALSRVGTRYGGPPPGSHGPWRWGQLESGSPLEMKLKAEIRSFPRRLPRRLRRYYDDKVVWVTGADHGLGERLAIHLTVNGAKVILTGTDLDELERVQRLCILAWMKAVDWEIMKACLEGLTRLDRVMVLPLDVRDDFILPDAAREARSMLSRPINMVFHCAGVSTTERRDIVEGPSRGNNSSMDVDLEMMEANLWGAVGLTKAVLPSMLDEEEGHIVVIGGENSLLALEGQSADVASRHALRGYFDSLRAEVARDHIKVTVAHPGPAVDPTARQQRGDTGRVGRTAALDTDVVARRVLAAVARGRKEVVVERWGWFRLSRIKGRLVARGLRSFIPRFRRD